ITGLSPVLSWARDADRMAFVYYENNKYDVYALDDPRSLRREPYRPLPAAQVAELASTTAGAAPVAAASDSSRTEQAGVGVGGSLYRSRQGFRSASELAAGDSLRPEGPVSIVALLDSATLALPESTEFTERPYRVSFTPDYVARPSIGYTRDTFGRGFFGGSTVALSDMLGNHQMVFSGYVNGNIIESQILAAYANLSSRINWAAGVTQDPYFFLEPSEIRVGTPFPDENTFVTNIRRIILRQAFAQAAYPFSRFRRMEASLRAVNVSDDMLEIREPYNPNTGFPTEDPSLVTVDGTGANYLQPSLAFVHDNALFGYTGPFFGRRWRFEASTNIGSWRFSQLSGDYRRYDQIVGPVVLATQLLYFGRIGRDANEFRIFAGTTELLRGHTSGSYRREECFDQVDQGTSTGCVELDRLVGTQVAVGKAELRFPILTQQIFRGLPLGVPPIEGALFYDVGLTWDENSTLKWRQDPGDETDPFVRVPLHTVGASLRTNLLGFVILRLDYSRPINRPGVGGLWTVSLGPTF
ncbi:MAG TPA: BamA/TamA family outer membrane protein, partial [Gemmatimonadales bacterium]